MWDSDTLPLILSLNNMFNYVSQIAETTECEISSF